MGKTYRTMTSKEKKDVYEFRKNRKEGKRTVYITKESENISKRGLTFM